MPGNGCGWPAETEKRHKRPETAGRVPREGALLRDDVVVAQVLERRLHLRGNLDLDLNLDLGAGAGARRRACSTVCARAMPLPWQPASGLRMNVLRRRVRNSSKKESISVGRMYVLGTNSNSSGSTACK